MTHSIPSLPQNIDPRIAEILRKRAEQAIVIEKTVPLSRRTPPAAPATQTSTVPMPAPTPQPTPTMDVPMPDAELGGLIGAVLPRIDALIRKAIADVRSDGRLTWAEALALAPEIRNIVSLVVGEMLPEIKGTSARELVILVLSVLLRQYVSPHLPALVRPYLTAQVLRMVVKGLETAYTLWVKPRLGKAI